MGLTIHCKDPTSTHNCHEKYGSSTACPLCICGCNNMCNFWAPKLEHSCSRHGSKLDQQILHTQNQKGIIRLFDVSTWARYKTKSYMVKWLIWGENGTSSNIFIFNYQRRAKGKRKKEGQKNHFKCTNLKREIFYKWEMSEHFFRSD